VETLLDHAEDEASQACTRRTPESRLSTERRSSRQMTALQGSSSAEYFRVDKPASRHPNGSCASRRTTVSRATPSQPQSRHQRSLGAVHGDDPARQDRPTRLHTLPGDLQAELVEPAEGCQIGRREGQISTGGHGAGCRSSVAQVEVFRMGGVRTLIIERPRPVSRRARRR
jgi:hypothetical protein